MAESKLPKINRNQNSDQSRKCQESKVHKRRYADYFEFAPIGYFTFDPSGVILDVNSNGALLLGSERNRLLHQSFNAFITPESRNVFDRHRRQLFRSHKIQACDVKLLNGSGRSTWVQLESLAVQNGSDVSNQFRTIINEITDRKLAEEDIRRVCDELEQKVSRRTAELEKINEQLRAQVFECEHVEAALRESEEKYSTLVEDALIGVYINRDGKIDFANDKFAAIYGYPKDELVGMDSNLLVHPEDRPMVDELRKKRLKGEKVPSEY